MSFINFNHSTVYVRRIGTFDLLTIEGLRDYNNLIADPDVIIDRKQSKDIIVPAVTMLSPDKEFPVTKGLQFKEVPTQLVRLVEYRVRKDKLNHKMENCNGTSTSTKSS